MFYAMKILRAISLLLERGTSEQQLHAFRVAIAAAKLAGWTEKTKSFEVGAYDHGRLFLVGLLHDAIEDGFATSEQVESVLAPLSELAYDVHILTRPSFLSYFEYIKRIALDPRSYASLVKIADLEDNLYGRGAPPPGNLERRYKEALRILHEVRGI